jgi:glycosyltransferase involved in cell wall biosynthesis
MERNRILHIIDSLNRAGTESQLVLNLSALDRARFTNYLCYLHPVDFLAADARSLGAHVFCLRLNGKRQWLSGIYRLVKFIKTMKIDLVHTNLYESDVIGGVASKLSGVPVICTWASPAGAPTAFKKQLHLNSYKLGLSMFLQRMIYKTCHNHFIAVSEHVKTSWINRRGFDQTRITVIPRAISQSLSQSVSVSVISEARKKLSLDNSYPIIFNVGRLTPQKGQEYILEAMPFILNNFPEAKLLIAGEGPLRNEMENMIKDLGLNNVVSLLGNRDDIKILHLASDIFVFPSLSEGMPGALLEAAALGKPCVVADIEPVREILEDTKSGLFIPQHDSKALAQAVVRLSANRKEAHALGLKARETVLNRFIINNTVRKLEELYIKILNNRGRTKQ